MTHVTMVRPKAQFLDGSLLVYFGMVNDGGALVMWDNDAKRWNLYEVPQFGGEPRFVECGTDLNRLVEIGNSWT